MAKKHYESPRLSPMSALINQQLEEAQQTPLPINVHPPVITALPTPAQQEQAEEMERRANQYRVNLG